MSEKPFWNVPELMVARMLLWDEHRFREIKAVANVGNDTITAVRDQLINHSTRDPRFRKSLQDIDPEVLTKTQIQQRLKPLKREHQLKRIRKEGLRLCDVIKPALNRQNLLELRQLQGLLEEI